MPEEINRIVTDRLADMLFTPSEDGDINLAREGVPAEKIYRVGNVMIDTLVQFLPVAMQCPKNGLPDWKPRFSSLRDIVQSAGLEAETPARLCVGGSRNDCRAGGIAVWSLV